MNEKEKWGFIDENGNLVIDYHYDEVEQFQGGLALCTVEGKKIYFDKDGNEILRYRFIYTVVHEEFEQGTILLKRR